VAAGRKLRAAADTGVRDALAGTAGGIACVVAGHPFDTVKVRMQLAAPGEFRGAAHCLADTFASNGLRRGLYAGAVPALAANVSENAVLFMFYNQCQSLVRALNGAAPGAALTDMENCAAGAAASVFSSLVRASADLLLLLLLVVLLLLALLLLLLLLLTPLLSQVLCPTERVKVLMQAEASSAAVGTTRLSPWQCVRNVLRTEGAAGVTRGLGATVAREMPGNAAFFGGYEWSRRVFARWRGCEVRMMLLLLLLLLLLLRLLLVVLVLTYLLQVETLPAMDLVTSGAMGGISFWLVAYPLDVVKTRIQVRAAAAAAGGDAARAATARAAAARAAAARADPPPPPPAGVLSGGEARDFGHVGGHLPHARAVRVCARDLAVPAARAARERRAVPGVRVLAALPGAEEGGGLAAPLSLF